MSKTRTARHGTKDPAKGLFADNEMIDIAGIFGVLRRRKWSIAAITIAGTVAAYLYGSSVIPIYNAQATLLVEPSDSGVAELDPVNADLNADFNDIATQIRLLQSHNYQARVMEDLGLFDDPEFNSTIVDPDAPPKSALARFIEQPLDTMLAWLPSEWLITSGTAQEPELESVAPYRAREKALDRFRDSVEFLSDPVAYIITIGFNSPDPEKAARIANRIAEIYVDDQLNNKIFATDRTSAWLQDRLTELEVELREAEEKVGEFRSTNLVGESEGQGMTLTQQELSDLNRDLIVTRGELAEKQAKLRLVRDLRGSGRSLDSIAEVVESPLILSLRQQETELLREEAELSSLYGERHPRMIWLRNEKQNLEAKINSEVERIILTLQNDLSVTATRIASIESQLGDVKTQNVTDQAAGVQLAQLERQAESTRTLYEAFLNRFKETREQLEIVQPDVRIVSMASPPTVPTTPGKKLFAAAGLVISFGLSALLAIVLDRFDRGIRSGRQIEQKLGLHTLALVPRLDRLKKNQKPYQYLMEKPLSAYAEAIRSIYMAVKLSNVDREPKVVLATSSLPQEGKTTFAVSLATFAARSHKRVLLIDLDLRHPSVHRELGWQVSGGLVEYMANERSLEEVIHHDLETGLHFLPIKGQTTNPTDLLDSQKMRLLIESLRDSYDYIVLDSAPLASVTDTRVAALLADKVLFCLRWGQTMIGAAEDSIQALAEVGIEPAGAVLTMVDMKKHARYGYGDVGQYYTQSQKYYVN
ncbi:MAG: Wzz/FepE/Etk N-terminal domain-containing protein [Geminicoccaceae bacterium]|jgi:capsular exopolysaccharide synthesis family protein|nr:Wzz/FepE/Etk N-terminal domain-containing protein [Hyphomonas sp.]